MNVPDEVLTTGITTFGARSPPPPAATTNAALDAGVLVAFCMVGVPALALAICLCLRRRQPSPPPADTEANPISDPTPSGSKERGLLASDQETTGNESEGGGCAVQ